MLYIMTQSVKTKSREIFLGDSFSAWLRRMGIDNTNSGGARASRTLVQEQVDRLMACEWTIRFDQPVKASSADLVKQQKSQARAVRADRKSVVKGKSGSVRVGRRGRSR